MEVAEDWSRHNGLHIPGLRAKARIAGPCTSRSLHDEAPSWLNTPAAPTVASHQGLVDDLVSIPCILDC